MSSLYEQLQSQLGDRGAGSLSTVDMMSLPPTVRQLVRLMLRRSQMTYDELCQAVDALPPEKRFSRAELDEALDALCRLGWFEQVESAAGVSYRVRLAQRSSTPSAGTSVQRQETRGAALLDELAASQSDAAPSRPAASPPQPVPSASQSSPATPKPRRGFFQRLRDALIPGRQDRGS